MDTLLYIGILGITLFGLFLSITRLRIYFRTRMKGLFWAGVGLMMGFIGGSVEAIRFLEGYPSPWKNPYSLPFFFFLMMIVGAFIAHVGIIMHYTKESGLWNEICEKTSMWQRFIGDVPVSKDDKLPSPMFSKRIGLIVGISLMAAGILTSIPFILLRISKIFLGFFITSIIVFIIGLLLIIFSIAYLDKGQKSSK